MTKEVEHFFMCFMAILVTPFENLLSSSVPRIELPISWYLAILFLNIFSILAFY